MDKKTIVIDILGEPCKIDIECVDLVLMFNKLGLKTEYSCSGHGEHPFQILFSQDVGDAQMISFIEEISHGKSHTPIVGMFFKWVRKINGKTVHTWAYQAYSIESAAIDYDTINQIYEV